jgi:hypothetical protein
MGSLLLVCMGDDNEIKGRKMLDEQEWSNCIGCFPLSFSFQTCSSANSDEHFKQKESVAPS